MKKVINAGDQSVTFKFDGLNDIIIRMADVRPANATYAMLHGFAARIGDKAAIQKSDENGFKVTEAMRHAAVLEMVEHYTSGSEQWELKTSARVAPLNPAILKLAEKMGKTYEEAQAWFAAKLEAELSAE